MAEGVRRDLQSDDAQGFPIGRIELSQGTQQVIG
jgi:hypothetical protein